MTILAISKLSYPGFRDCLGRASFARPRMHGRALPCCRPSTGSRADDPCVVSRRGRCDAQMRSTVRPIAKGTKVTLMSRATPIVEGVQLRTSDVMESGLQKRRMRIIFRGKVLEFRGASSQPAYPPCPLPCGMFSLYAPESSRAPCPGM